MVDLICSREDLDLVLLRNGSRNEPVGYCADVADGDVKQLEIGPCRRPDETERSEENKLGHQQQRPKQEPLSCACVAAAVQD
jgi:hypothetical protein